MTCKQQLPLSQRAINNQLIKMTTAELSYMTAKHGLLPRKPSIWSVLLKGRSSNITFFPIQGKEVWRMGCNEVYKLQDDVALPKWLHQYHVIRMGDFYILQKQKEVVSQEEGPWESLRVLGKRDTVGFIHMPNQGAAARKIILEEGDRGGQSPKTGEASQKEELQ